MYTVYTKYLPTRPKLWSISLYDQPFSRYKVVKNCKCTQWPEIQHEYWTVKSTLYILSIYPWGPNFLPVPSTTSRVKILPIYNSPIDYHGNRPKRTLKCQKKFKVSNFTILLTLLVETLPRDIYMNSGEWNWRVLSDEMSFETFTPIWSDVCENEK